MCIFIEPIIVNEISDYPLDSVEIGQSITIGCVVRTCGTPNVVTFTRASTSAVQERISRAEDGAFNWNPEVTCNLTGAYTCTVQNQLGTVSRTFRITGIYNYISQIIFSINHVIGTPQRYQAACGGCNTSTLSVMFFVSSLLISLATIIFN